MHTSASRAGTGLIGGGALFGAVGAIALSCTGLAGRWCDKAFHGMFHGVLGGSARGYGAIHFVAEKSVHVTLFAGLAVALWHCFRHTRRRTTYAVMAGFALGCSSELLQRLFPGRDPAIRDVLINWSSVVLGLGMSHLAPHFLRYRRAQAAFALDRTAGDLVALSFGIEETRNRIGAIRTGAEHWNQGAETTARAESLQPK